MPIVFVHGVNNRDGNVYRETQVSRDGFLREIIAPALGLSPDGVHLSSPYWGAKGAQFAWEMAVLPDAMARFENFGSGEDLEAFGRVETVLATSALAGGSPIIESAQRDFAGVVDVLYASAMAGAKTESQARDIARSYLTASAYAEKNPAPAWLTNTVETNFVDQLNDYADASKTESFGPGGILDSLKEGFSRLVNALPDVASGVATRLARKQLNATVTRFAGDAFTYLARRGTKEAPGEIIKIVINALRDAVEKRTAQDDKLIIIAHSFGGEIVYDILTYFDTGLEVDCLLTVGSQVGLFEEMKLYVESKATIPQDPPKGRVPRPPHLKRWLNVFDLNDVLSYRIEPVFAGTSDFQYDTGYSSLSAHGGYFMRPSFFRRLAVRLQE